MYKDINNQIQRRIVYSIIFQISYTRNFANYFAEISQMYHLFSLIFIDQSIIKL